MYCKSRNFRESFIFRGEERYKSYLRRSNSRLGHDLPTSVNDRVIPPFREGFIFTIVSRK